VKEVRVTPQYPPGLLGAAIAGKHLGFCRRLYAARRRVGAWRPRLQRVFLRMASARSRSRNVYAPTFTTTAMSGPRLQLTLAPSIHVDLHWRASIASPIPSRPFQVRSPAARIIASRPWQCAATVLRRTESGRGRSRPASALSDRVPLVHQVVERQSQAELPRSSRAIVTVRRSDVRRVETVLRQLPAAAVALKADPAPGSSPRPERRRTGPWAVPAQGPASPAKIPDAEVVRLTERVIQQINRRILAERERRGR
jgi:hypothetical protein